MKFNSLFFKSEKDVKGKSRIPLLYVGPLYFAEGFPYVIVIMVSGALYSTPEFGISNRLIGLTSLLYWPWVIKMFWGPVVDRFSTIRTWLLFMQVFCTLLFAILAWSVSTNSLFTLTFSVFAVISFASATHDIAIDGFYMLSLEKKKQAFFIGIRSLFYRFAMMFEGVLVSIAGILEIEHGVTFSWISVFAICACIFAALSLFHIWYLPRPRSDIKKEITSGMSFGKYYLSIFKEFFAQKKIISILAFIFLYRFGEGMIAKMIPPFLRGFPETGALGISTLDYGILKGTFGTIGLIVGGIFGGWMIARYGLRKCIWPMALALNVPNLLYVYLAYAKPELIIVGVAVTLEMIGYGVGFAAFMMFLITISKGENKTSLYAIATGIMAFGLMVPGMVSGFVQEWLGYQYFFIAATILTIPGMIMLFFIPLENQTDSE